MWKGTTKAKWEFAPKPSRMRLNIYRRLKQQYDELRGRWMAGSDGTLWHQGKIEDPAIDVARDRSPRRNQSVCSRRSNRPEHEACSRLPDSLKLT